MKKIISNGWIPGTFGECQVISKTLTHIMQI